MRSPDVARLAGLALAAVGIAHYAKPEAFESITRRAFPNDIRQHTYVNGGIETALGVGLANPPTRRLAVAGLVGYLAYLGVNAARNAGWAVASKG
ncbi:MAG: hypothetical protein JO152_16985 [Mycobacteriaceae bacterium]|nr:hypothetical protein [Mycobacteriaceae bacterium]